MMKKTVSILAALMISLGAVSCGSADSSGNDPAYDIAPVGQEYSFESENSELTEEFKTAASDLSVKLLQNACREDIEAGKNAMVSPGSVILSLGLAANGAGGNTLAEFEKLLGGNMESINKNLCSLMTSAKNEENVDFGIANSIWVKDSDKDSFKTSYAEVCKKRLDAESFSEPFNDETVDKLNSWVKDKTNGMIGKLLDSFSGDEAAVLLNCIAFEGEWLNKYEEKDVESHSIFIDAKSNKQECTMLSSTEHIYLSDDKAEGFMKYYKGGRYAFAALLPDISTSLSDYIGSLTGEKLKNILTSAASQEVETKMPEFRFDWGSSITDSIKAMGLESPFSGAADFSNMSDQPLMISDIIHKTHIEVNSNGTKAAAATAGMVAKGMIVRDEKKRVYLNRPFVFMIVDTQTALPMFIGGVNEIKDE